MAAAKHSSPERAEGSRPDRSDETRKPRSGKALVIVESPAKAKTISRFLGPGFVVESSLGHVRDLPSTAAEIPAKFKQEEWARIGVNVAAGFQPLYIVPAKKKSQVTKLRQLVQQASEVFLATDEDREGEAIAWHLKEVLDPRVPVRRMVFDEITEPAIKAALRNPRDLDDKLVNAQEARRILDRLYGYEVSPVLWRKIGPKLSAGRVQSVATRLIVARERERMRFRAADYWDVEATLRTRTSGHENVFTRMVELAGKRIALGKDFDPQTGQLNREADVRLIDGALAGSLVERLRAAEFSVESVTERPFVQRPNPPFITSSMQQEAARKLRFGVQHTMRLAQSLYENGYITYMRTDSTHLSSQAIQAARAQASQLYGAQYVPDAPRHYTTKAKGAQEAHEAIRPAGEVFRTPREVEHELPGDAFRLYDLIWKRTLACQMKDASGSRTTVRFAAEAGEHGRAIFSATGKTISFDGFLRAYVQGSDEPEADADDQERILPSVARGDVLDPATVEPRKHTTQPPARYTEATLIKELEERGIGRPSTYATIIQTIQDRGYVWKKGPALVPTFTAFAVINLLERHFHDLVDFDFTAKMEDDLDAIASGTLSSKPWLHDFYFGPSVEGGNGTQDLSHVGLKRRISTGGEKIDPREISTIPLGEDEDGQPVNARIGRYGPYIQVGDGEQRANIPEDIAPDELNVATAKELLSRSTQGAQVVGHDPATGKPVYVKSGRFGPYVQLGDPETTEKGTPKRGGKPKMASLWPSMNPAALTLEQALKVLSFPRTLGTHPQTGEPITVQDGRFGPYIKMGTETRSLANHEALETTTLEQALQILAQPKRGRGAARQQQTLSELGKHPASGGAIHVKQGRYGPYVTDGTVNASLPKGLSPAELTLEKAIELLNAREQRLREQGQDPRAPKPASRRPRRRKPSGNADAAAAPAS